MKHIYPEWCTTDDQKRRWRRDARKAARADGSYVPQSYNQVAAPTRSRRRADTDNKLHTNPNRQTCTGCGFQIVEDRNQPNHGISFYLSKPYHNTCHPMSGLPDVKRQENDWKPDEIPPDEIIHAKEMGWNIEQILRETRNWGKPECYLCNEHIWPWDELGEFVYQDNQDETSRVRAHAPCGIDEGLEIA